MAHTPGPWIFEMQESHVGGHHQHECLVTHYKLPNRRGIKIVAKCGDNTNENEANARLIAAAPGLLEALEGLLEYYIDGVDWAYNEGSLTDAEYREAQQYETRAEQAIAAAKGVSDA